MLPLALGKQNLIFILELFCFFIVYKISLEVVAWTKSKMNNTTNINSSRRSRDPRVSRLSRDPRVSRRSRDPRVSRLSRDPRVSRRSRDPRVSRRSSDPRVSRRSRDPRGSRLNKVIPRTRKEFTSPSFLKALIEMGGWVNQNDEKVYTVGENITFRGSNLDSKFKYIEIEIYKIQPTGRIRVDPPLDIHQPPLNKSYSSWTFTDIVYDSSSLAPSEYVTIVYGHEQPIQTVQKKESHAELLAEIRFTILPIPENK